jgi:hypothetical protein
MAKPRRGSRPPLAGHEDLLLWGGRLDAQRVWAIEDCRHVSGALERFLLARGERVVRVAPKLTAGARSAARERGKSAPSRATHRHPAARRTPPPPQRDRSADEDPDAYDSDPIQRATCDRASSGSFSVASEACHRGGPPSSHSNAGAERACSERARIQTRAEAGDETLRGADVRVDPPGFLRRRRSRRVGGHAWKSSVQWTLSLTFE